MIEALKDARALVTSRSSIQPEVGLVLGSGLGPVSDEMSATTAIPYREIPGFPGTTVPGHRGELVLGEMEGLPVAVLRGRAHLYEGYSAADITYPVRLLNALGTRTLIVTNAAGGLRSDMKPGSFLILEDHINLPGLAGRNPLVGPHDVDGRFVDMSAAYDGGLRRHLLEIAADQGITATSGVYVMVAGPSYETPAEARMLRALGADAVGMSTAPEVVVARRLGMRVAGISCITNVLIHEGGTGEVDHQGVVAASQRAVPDMVSLLRGLLRRIREE